HFLQLLTGLSYLAEPLRDPERPMSTLQSLTFERLQLQLAPRERATHKGDYGHVLVIGGDSGTGGAAIMAAEAAARSGAGLTSLATRPEHVSAALQRRPE